MRFMHGFSGHTFKAIRGDGSWNYIKYLTSKGSSYGANVLTGSRHSPTKASVITQRLKPISLLGQIPTLEHGIYSKLLNVETTRPGLFTFR